MPHPLKPLALAALALALAACSSSDSTSPGGGALAASPLTAVSLNGSVGGAVATRPAVRVLRGSSPASGVAVTFAVVSGGGSVTGGNATTDALGVATVGSWTLGAGPDSNRLEARVAGVATPIVFTASTGFTIDLRFLGALPSAPVRTAFTNAAARWAQVITADVPDYPLGGPGDTIPAGSCGPNPQVASGTIDDVIIYAEVDSIDGAGQILGEAGPCFIRSDTDLRTLVGYMHFDAADMQDMVNTGAIGDVILHEMGHVLGIGTLWDGSLSRAQTTEADTGWIRTTDVRHTGTAATAAFAAMGGNGGVPVENCAAGVPSSCGPGTWMGHWRESSFRNELMTGYIAGSGNPLSRATIGALADLGYGVSYAAADSYSYAPASASFLGPVRGTRLNELPFRAVYRLGTRGGPTRVR